MDIYLDNAATSHPKPAPVLEAVQEAMTSYNANPGRSGHARALAGAREILSGREQLAQLINASDAFEIIYCFNCTDALNLGIKGSLHKGDHVVSTLLEHNSVLRVLMGLQATGQIELTLISPTPEGFIEPDAIARAMQDNTRLVVMTHASNVIGALQPVEEVGALCRARQVRYLVDGAQALGAVPVDVGRIGCALYAFPGHKGLLGPQGTGGLYIAPGTALNTLREGGTGSSSDNMRQPDEQPERFESGTVNLHGIAGMNAGVKYVLEHGALIRVRERELTAQIIDGLARIEGVSMYGPRDDARRVGVVSFNVGDYPSSAVADALDRSGIAVRGGLHCAQGVHRSLGTTRRGAVRASVGHANTADEIDQFLTIVREILMGEHMEA